jgi:hypothetical protein
MTTHANHLTHDEVEQAGSLTLGGGLRAIEVVALVFLGLLVCPPLAILTVVVVVPILVLGLVFALLGAVLSVPYLIVHRARGHRGHGALFVQRLRGAGRALLDLAPHRIVADAPEAARGR